MFCPLYSEARLAGENEETFQRSSTKALKILPPPQNPNQYSPACITFLKFSLRSQKFTISGEKSRSFRHESSLRSRRKRERGRGARMREKNGVLGAPSPRPPALLLPLPLPLPLPPPRLRLLRRLPRKRPFVFRLIRSAIAADTGTRHRNKIAPDPG